MILNNRSKLILVLLIAVLVFITGCQIEQPALVDNPIGRPDDNLDPVEDEVTIDENGYYTLKDEVALYLFTYDKLPSNYITKKEAADLGWDAQKGNLWDVTDKMSIGGDRFGNREKLLPEKEGRIYYECDINYEGGYRGSERIVYSNDGLIFYTSDHYESFEQLY